MVGVKYPLDASQTAGVLVPSLCQKLVLGSFAISRCLSAGLTGGWAQLNYLSPSTHTFTCFDLRETLENSQYEVKRDKSWRTAHDSTIVGSRDPCCGLGVSRSSLQAPGADQHSFGGPAMPGAVSPQPPDVSADSAQENGLQAEGRQASLSWLQNSLP